MSYIRTRSFLAAALLFAASGCSDSNDDPASTGGTAGQTGGGGTTAAGGTAGGGAAGTGGTSGAGGAAGTGGSGGSAGAGAGGSEQFPTPDKLVALSFDDGPSNTQTVLILDKLEAHGVPATFFLIGQNISAGTQPTLQRAAALGAEFGNHSQGYAALAPAVAADTITTSVNSTNAAILEFTGTNAVFFRPPNLAVDANLYTTVDMPFAGGLVGGDFPAQFGGNPTVQAVSDTILNGVQDGTIILLHDNQPDLNPYPTPDALDIIIPELKRRGFEILTVSELFARRGVDPNSMQDVIWSSVPPAP